MTARSLRFSALFLGSQCLKFRFRCSPGALIIVAVLLPCHMLIVCSISSPRATEHEAQLLLRMTPASGDAYFTLFVSWQKPACV